MKVSRPSSPPRHVLAGLLALVAAVLLLGTSAAFAAAPAADPAPGPSAGTTPVITFGVQPATAKDRDQRPFFTYNVTPGATLSDHVAVLNYSTQPITVQLYSTDAFNGSDGGFSLLTGTQKPVDAGAWTSLAEPVTSLVVPARASLTSGPGEVIVPFSVTVPANASPGDHAAGVLAVLSTTGKNKQGETVKLDQRVAARVYVRVSGDVHPGLAIENLKVTYHGTLNPFGAGSATVRFTVANNGNVKLGARPSAEVGGWFGTSARATGLKDIPLLFPGAKVDEVVTIHHVWPTLRLKAAVTLLPQRLEGDSDGPLDPVSKSVGTWAVPWTLVAIVLAIAVLFGGRALRRRRVRRTAAEATLAEVRARRQAKRDRKRGVNAPAADRVLAPEEQPVAAGVAAGPPGEVAATVVAAAHLPLSGASVSAPHVSASEAARRAAERARANRAGAPGPAPSNGEVAP